MIERLDAKQQRTLALAILVFAVLAVLCITVLPIWIANSNYTARIDQLTERLHGFETIARRDPELRRRYAELRRSLSSRNQFLSSDSEATAAAELQRILKTTSTTYGTNLVSTQILPAASENGALRIGLKVRLNGPLPGIVQTIYEVEASQVFMFLESFSLRQTGGVRRARTGPAVDVFEANFDLVAYMQEPP